MIITECFRYSWRQSRSFDAPWSLMVEKSELFLAVANIFSERYNTDLDEFCLSLVHKSFTVPPRRAKTRDSIFFDICWLDDRDLFLLFHYRGPSFWITRRKTHSCQIYWKSVEIRLRSHAWERKTNNYNRNFAMFVIESVADRFFQWVHGWHDMHVKIRKEKHLERKDSELKTAIFAVA